MPSAADQGPAARERDEVQPRLRAIRRLDELDHRFGGNVPMPTEPRGLARIHGTVTMASGQAVDGECYVVADTPTFDLLVRGTVREGAFDVEFDLGAERTVHVGVLCEAAPRGVQTLRVVPGGVHEVSFIMEGGLALKGLVVDPDGQPIGGLDVFVTSSPYRLTASYTDKYFDFHELKYAKSGSSYHERAAKTDARGAFQASGIGPGTYFVLSRSREWFIRQDYERVEPGVADLILVAEPALSLQLTARDARTDEPVPEFKCELVARVAGIAAYRMPVMGADGRASVTWRSLREGLEFHEGLVLELRFLAARYEEHGATLAYARDSRSASYDARMTPVPPGSARIHVVDEAGNPVDLPLAATLVAYRDGRNEPRNSEYPRLELSKLAEPGLYRLDAGVGTWWASVKPNIELGPLVSWRGTIFIPAGGGMGEAWVTLPSFGTVRFVLTDLPAEYRPTGTVRLQLKREEPGVATGIDVRWPEETVHGFPCGSWIVRFRGGVEPWETRFEVSSGSDVVVRVGAR